MSCIAALSGESNYYSCISPDCNSGQIHEDGEAEPIMTCVHCGSRSCVVHQIPFHEGETCSEYDNRMNQLRNELLEEQGSQPEASGNGARTDQKRKRTNSEEEDVESQIKHEVESLEEGAVKKRPRRPANRRQERRPEEDGEIQQRLEEERQRQRQKEVLREEMASSEALKSRRRCPGKGCGYWIEKNGGCDHMTCKPFLPPARLPKND